MPCVQLPPFFLAEEYPIDDKSETLLFVSVLLLSRKRFAMPAHWCNAGDVGEGGPRRVKAILLLVMAAKGASGKGGKGVSLVMALIF